ncbi:MAG: substrate-binding domain-containing protein, partial [Acidimicrobiia bacterium]
MSKRLWAFLAVIGMLLAACGGGSGSTTTTAGSGETTTTAGASEDIVVGMSWNNYNEERWAKADEPAMKAAIEAGGATYISSDAGSSAEQQLTDVENLISQGADVLIILAQDGTAILPAVQSALEQGIPVIAYDRLIEDPGAFYLTFDNTEVGRAEARVIFDLVPAGVYAIIKGNSADANADFLRTGYEDVIGDAVTAGDITICCETYTDNWDPALAQTEMEQFLTQENNAIDAVLSENDGMASGVVAALEAQGLAGDIPVSGQDGDAAALNRVALGTQAVSVWKNAYVLGQVAGDLAVQLAQGMDLSAVTVPSGLGDAAPAAGNAAGQFTTPGGVDVWSVILTPQPITQDTLNIVVDSGWITKDEVCQNVSA